eukprot:m.209299 g.209299  ORF g.209299 m.209299 type:complete len:307 (-) comp17808_c0_seq2:84-1004(-)
MPRHHDVAVVAKHEPPKAFQRNAAALCQCRVVLKLRQEPCGLPLRRGRVWVHRLLGDERVELRQRHCAGVLARDALKDLPQVRARVDNGLEFLKGLQGEAVEADAALARCVVVVEQVHVSEDSDDGFCGHRQHLADSLHRHAHLLIGVHRKPRVYSLDTLAVVDEATRSPRVLRDERTQAAAPDLRNVRVGTHDVDNAHGKVVALRLLLPKRDANVVFGVGLDSEERVLDLHGCVEAADVGHVLHFQKGALLVRLIQRKKVDVLHVLVQRRVAAHALERRVLCVGGELLCPEILFAWNLKSSPKLN